MANMFLRGVFLFCCLFLSQDTMMAAVNADENLYHVFDPQSLHPQQVCSTPKGDFETRNSTRLTLADRHGPCSPFTGNGKAPTLVEILEKDRLRLDYLHARMSTANYTHGYNNSQDVESKVKVPLQPGSTVGTGNYVVTIGLGTPRRLQTLELDTGSDICWVQCAACTSCYPQKEPKFNPLQSSSFRTMSCQSPACDLFHGGGQCAPGYACTYVVKYGDGSLTTGIVGQDMLYLGPRDVLSGFSFGCGLLNKGLFSGTAGLIGLGRGPTSLISQTERTYDNLFSYCLPKTSSSTGFLNLGGFVSIISTTYTPMLQLQNSPSFYGLSLVGINVYGQPVPIAPSTISSVPAIIDSGTVITRLPPDAYAALRTTFLKYMSNYTQAPAVGILDTCFDFSDVSGPATIPMIELRFARGASLKLGLEGMLIPMGDKPGVACLAFATDARFLLIGNIQQRGYEVVYDIYRRRIGFKPAAC